MKTVWEKCRRVLRFCSPGTTAEWLVFLFFFLSYGLFSFYIAQHSSIIFDNRIPWDAYLSFDNRAIIMTGGGYERHPLSIYFFDTLRSLFLLISNGKYDSVFRTCYAMLCSLSVALAVLWLYKYVRNVIQLPIYISTVLSVLFGFSATALFLSFTPENYTFTLPLMVLFLYYHGCQWKRQQRPHPALTGIFAIALGGFTITNFAVPLLAHITDKKWWQSRKAFFIMVWSSLVTFLLFALLFAVRIQFQFQAFLSKSGQQYEKFSQQKVTPFWDMAMSWFWGGNFLLPGYILRDYYTKKGFHYAALFLDTYHGVLPYLTVILVAVGCISALLLNKKKSPVLLLGMVLLFNILLHLVLRFGLHTAYIYGAHFIFCVPLLLGWLYKWSEKREKINTVLAAVYICLAIYVLVNNGWRLLEFIKFMQRYHAA